MRGDCEKLDKLLFFGLRLRQRGILVQLSSPHHEAVKRLRAAIIAHNLQAEFCPGNKGKQRHTYADVFKRAFGEPLQ